MECKYYTNGERPKQGHYAPIHVPTFPLKVAGGVSKDLVAFTRIFRSSPPCYRC
jgi:hypothetical protein